MSDERSLLLRRLETAQADCMDDGQAAAAILLQDARGLLREQAKRIEALEAALFTIYANTEPDAIPHISYDGMTAYQALAKDIADCARAALAPEQDK